MADRNRVADRVELHLDDVALTGLELLGLLVAVAVGEVQQPSRDEVRLAVRPDVAQPDDDEGERAVRGDLEAGEREPEDLDGLGQRPRCRSRATRRPRAAGPRVVDRAAVAAPGARIGRDRLRTADRELPLGRRLAPERARSRRARRCGRRPSRRPALSGEPASRPVRAPRLGPDGVRHVDPQHRLVHDAVVDSLQVAVPPADGLLQEADRRAGSTALGVDVGPRADQPLARSGVALEETQDRVAVGVGPAADHVDRAADGREVLADRALSPELVAALVRDPLLDVRRRTLHALEPGLAPGVADDRRVGRPGVVGEHHRGPLQHVRGQTGSRPCSGRRPRSGRRSRRR